PDVVTLQEVQRDNKSCSADEIAHGIGLEHVYYFPDKPNEPKSSGVAILSKYKADQQHFLRLSRDMHDEKDKGNKVFGAIEFKVEGQPFLIGTTWLSVSTEAQRRTTREIAYFTNKIIGNNDSIIVLTGDLNNYT